MPRGPRLDLVGVPVHVIQRGNNRTACFACEDDYPLYLYYLHEAAARSACAVHAYVLMTNHVHLLLTPREPHAVSRLMQQVGRRYVRRFNMTRDRTGTLWEGRFRSSVIDSERYFLACQRYIEHNPVRAGMVRNALEYPWSSHRHYAAGRRDPLVTEHACFLQLGGSDSERREAYRAICAAGLPEEEVKAIRVCLNTGRPLGSDQFRAQVSRDVPRALDRQRQARAGRARRDRIARAGQPRLIG